jgi:uncharacterized membrane protein YozB (DUF420 family)
MRAFLLMHIFLMAAAVIFIISAVVAARRKKQGWLNRHRALAITGAISAGAAFALIFISKTVMHYPHFHSPHAVAGAVTLALLIMTPVSGALVVSGKNSLRTAHRILGRTTSLALVLTALSGIFRMVQISKR